MKALRFHETGSPTEVLRLEPLELPALADGEVRLKILAAPINPADLNFIEGTYGVKPELPATPGIEGCGEVVESQAPGFRPGDRAILLRRAGTWASHAQLPAENLFRLPEGLDPQQAAMLKVNAATAWRLLHADGPPARGSWIVQNASNSGVGRCVIAVAKRLGIRTMNFVRRAELVGELEALGADMVVTDDDAGLAAAKEALGTDRAVLAFNAVGGESALRLMNLLGTGGLHLTYGAMGRRPFAVPAGMLIFKDLRIQGLWVSRWVESAPREELEEVYEILAGMIRDGEIRVPVDSVYPLEEITSALERSAESRDGKVLLVP